MSHKIIIFVHKLCSAYNAMNKKCRGRRCKREIYVANIINIFI